MNTLRPPDSVLDLLRKVRALATAGVAGERDAARARLDQLLQRHGVREEQLDETLTTAHPFACRNEHERMLLICIVARVATAGEYPQAFCKERDKRVYYKLTPAQIIDVETQLDFYKKLWRDEQRVFFRAFINAQSLGVNSSTTRELTDQQLAEIRRMLGMSEFINRKTPHRQLEVRYGT